LAAVFVFNGQHVLVVNNHFTSKGGSTALYGNTQPAINGGADSRTAQATIVNTFINSALQAVPDAHVVALGDLNEFSFLGPLLSLSGADNGTPIVRDVLDRLNPVERYTYVFEGNSQALDHMFVTDNLYRNADVGIRHVDAEFADQVSDHDPIVAQFSLAAADSSSDDADTGVATMSDGSGGCTIGTGRDAGLPLLAILAALILAWRRRQSWVQGPTHRA